jgi:hypothetical protein
MIKNIYIFCNLLFSIFFYYITLIPYYFFKNNIKKNQLTDLGFILTPNLSKYSHIYDNFTLFLAFCTLIFYNQNTDEIIDYNLSIMFNFISLGYLISSTCHLFTFMPFPPTISIGISVNDNIISNHTYNIGLLLITLEKCNYIYNNTLILLSFLYGLGIILIRIHYTVDVILAFWFLFFSYKIWDNFELII